VLTSTQSPIELAKAIRKYKELAKTNQIVFYKPYPKQREFHRAGKDYAERCLGAGNQLGKCATKASFIELADGSRYTFQQMYDYGGIFDVMAWDGTKPVIATAIQPIKKPSEPCVRIWLASGHWFECALNHRMLMSDGAYVFVSQLLECLPSLAESSSESSQLIHAVNAQHLNQIQQGFLFGCLESLRLCDVLLHSALSIVRSLAQRYSGALLYNSPLFCLGDPCSIDTNNHQQACDHPSSLGVVRHSLGHFFESLDCVAYRFSQYTRQKLLTAQQLCAVSVAQLQSTSLNAQYLQSCDSPNNANHIISYKAIASQDVYDFSVPVYENYISSGCVHHNTLCGSFEMAYHLTGLYPDWWDGLRFEKPVIAWVGGVTGLTIRDSTQKLLIGRIQDPDGLGTGAIPKHLIIEVVKSMGAKDLADHVKIKHITGGTSIVFMKSYEQGREKWQAETVDIIWCDEEPPADIYAEALTRTNHGQKGQRMMMTFTPLKGVTEVVRKFYEDPSQYQKLIMMTIWDVEHYTEAEKAQIVDSYPEHEKDARSKGIPTMGSGRVFPISEEKVKVDPFRIPKYWPRIKGMDFGYDHPTALSCCAWDRDNDIFYVYDVYTAKGTDATPSYFAPAVNRRESWIPVAWPHDGLQHDKGSGIQLAQQYKDAGIEMLYERATFSDGSNGLEAGVMDMLDRMKTGRLKVFSTCPEWFEEFRLYHRKDGVIVKLRDDVLAATRYALMMKRHAEIEDTDEDYRPTVHIDKPSTGY